jgi:hypothetical protein
MAVENAVRFMDTHTGRWKLDGMSTEHEMLKRIEYSRFLSFQSSSAVRLEGIGRIKSSSYLVLKHDSVSCTHEYTFCCLGDAVVDASSQSHIHCERRAILH